jgi:serine/threonine-protein kinase HipA
LEYNCNENARKPTILCAKSLQMLYIGITPDDKNALRVVAHRGQLITIARGIYSDEPVDSTRTIQANLLAIIAGLLPDWHLSYSTAATLTSVNGFAFVSSHSSTHSPVLLPGLRIIRGRDLPYPEIDWLEAPTQIASSLQQEPQTVKVAVSSPLQTVFECLSAARSYPERTLPESKLIELIQNLSESDRQRAQAFAARNDLQAEYWRFAELMDKQQLIGNVQIAKRREFQVFFYGWQIGRLTGLGSEYRFEYSPHWQVELSPQLPLSAPLTYEGRQMPMFFENMLPEGWMESQLQATFKIAKEDKLGLLATSQKYLSNLTLRPPNFETSEITFDTLQLKLSELAPKLETILSVEDHIVDEKTLQDVLRGLGSKGPVRVSGIQAKLPVALTRQAHPTLHLGVLGNSCSHIIKYQSPTFPNLVENEWATMELARRAGLNVAFVRMIEASNHTELFSGRALLIERYDIPGKNDLEQMQPSLKLALQQDAAALLDLAREEKYGTSGEKIAQALVDLKLSETDYWAYLSHLIFSWFVANGDLHAKNISLIKWLTPGKLGLYPQLSGITYSPLYDLVNTRIYMAGDKFAITVNGRNDKLKRKDFAAVATRWGGTKEQVLQIMQDLAASIQENIDEVMEQSRLLPEQVQAYREAVANNIECSLG